MDRSIATIIGNSGVARRRGAAAARPGRRSAATILAAAALALVAAGPAEAAGSGPPGSETALLKQIYATGIARMAQGDPGRAVSVFQVIVEVAPDMPQAHYSLALAMTLADFTQRDRALRELEKAMASDARQPLYQVLHVMDDAALSSLGQDGALYLTADAAKMLREAAAQLPQDAAAYNARYLGPVLAGVQAGGDATHPYRLPGFASMLGQGGMARLPQFGDAQLAFGRLFAMSVPDAEFAAHEQAVVARLQDGLDSLSYDSIDAARMHSREDELRRAIERPSG